MKQGGFTLTEIVIALALTTLIGLSMSSIMTFNYRATNSAGQNFDITQVQLLAQQATMNSLQCPQSLYNSSNGPTNQVLVTPSTNPSTVSATIDRLVQVDARNGISSTIMDTAAPTIDLYLVPFTLTTVAQVNASTYIMNFNINATKVAPGLKNIPIIGGSSLAAQFPLYVYLDTTNGGPPYPILQCTSAGGISTAGPMVKAWVTYNNGAVSSSFNIALTNGVTSPAAGLYTVNFLNPLPNNVYSVSVTSSPDASGNSFFVEAPVMSSLPLCGTNQPCPGALSTTGFTLGMVSTASSQLAAFSGTFTATVVQ